MREFLQIFFILLKVTGLYFTLISLFALLPLKKAKHAAAQLRFAVLIPARNEAACMPGIIRSLKNQNYPPELYDIYVIPNHCTDDTAGEAVRNGAKLLPVSSAVSSKGAALHEAFACLLRHEQHDAYCVLDADNEAAPDFLSEMNRALQTGARAVKSRILTKNAADSVTAACYEIYFCNANVFLNRARGVLGLPARLIGTGFALRRDLLEELGGWNTATLTEDAEFYATLAARGEHIAFCPEAVTYDEQPRSFRESLVQRRRWMSGVLEVGWKKAPALLAGLRSPRSFFGALDAAMQFLFPLLQTFLLPLACVKLVLAPQTLLTGAASFYLGALLTGLAALLLQRRLNRHTAKALLFYPVFVFSFLPLLTWSLFFPNKTWTPILHMGSPVQS